LGKLAYDKLKDKGVGQKIKSKVGNWASGGKT